MLAYLLQNCILVDLQHEVNILGLVVLIAEQHVQLAGVHLARCIVQAQSGFRQTLEGEAMCLARTNQITEYPDIIKRKYPEGVFVPHHERSHFALTETAIAQFQRLLVEIENTRFVLADNLPVEQVLVEWFSALEHKSNGFEHFRHILQLDVRHGGLLIMTHGKLIVELRKDPVGQ